MKLSRFAVLGLVGCLCVAAPALAQDEDEDFDDIDIELYDAGEEDFDEDFEDLAAPLFATGDSVHIKSAIVGAPGNRIAVGKEVAVLCGFVNAGDEPLNVTGIFGTLNEAADYSKVLMNLTGQGINEQIEGDSENTYSYRFRMPKDLQPLPQTLQLALHIVFSEEDAGPASQQLRTFFNETVEFVEAETEQNWGALLSKIVFTVVCIGIAFVAYTLAAGASPLPSVGAASATTVAASGDGSFIKASSSSGRRARRRKN